MVASFSLCLSVAVFVCLSVCVCVFVSLFLSVWMSKGIDLLFDPIVPWLGFGDHRLLSNVKEEREIMLEKERERRRETDRTWTMKD